MSTGIDTGNINHPPAILYGGTADEPQASMNMSCFLDPVKEQLVEGVRILDYGCGAGILLNVLSERIKDFTYYGVEVDTDYGRGRIALGQLLGSRCQ